MLLTAAVLSLLTVVMLAWRAMRASPDEPARLIGALRLAQWCAVLLAAVGAIPIGLALSASADSLGGMDAALGIVTIGTAALASAWRTSTRISGRPLARAVRM